MLVPRDQAPIALKIRPRTFTELTKQARTQMPITESNLEKLKILVLESLSHGPATAEQLQNMVPSALVKNFSPELKRIGFTNSLALAINLLKEEGKVLKTQPHRRLDSTTYSYTLLKDALPEVDPFELRREVAYTQLAAQYFKSEGPARMKDFAWWAGINVTDAIKAANDVKPHLKPVFVEGTKDEYLISETDLNDFYAFEQERSKLNFVPYRDTYLKGQREIVDRFGSSEHADKPFSRWKDRKSTRLDSGR